MPSRNTSEKMVTVVAYAHGRVGSSATMGILRLAGLNVGRSERLQGSTPMNPKGFLELPSQNIFLKVAYPGIHGEVADPPSLEILDRKGKMHAEAYLDFLEHEFDGDYPIAVKAQGMLTLPFLHELRDELDTKVLLLDRDTDEQISSLERAWKQLDIRQEMSSSDIRAFLLSWKDFRDKVSEHYDFPACRIQFGNLIQSPYETTQRIASFLDVSCPPEKEVREWIDPDLVNRNELKSTNSGSLTLTQRARRPEETFRKLYDQFGLEFTNPVREEIRAHSESSNGSGSDLRRESRSVIRNWEQRLSSSEIDRVRRRTESVASKFYSDADW